MSNRDLIAIGTSAGGVEALIRLAANLPPDIPAALLVTIHLASSPPSELDVLLTRSGPLPARFASDGEVYRKRTIYLAPPDRHLLVEGDRLRLGAGPRENNSRPAIDPMLRSAALCCGARAVGVVLTGTLGDGASGLWAIVQCGGLSVVQDPSDAAYADMPLNALSKVDPDHLVALAQLPDLLTSLAHQPAGPTRATPEGIAFEVGIARGRTGSMDEMDHLGRRSVLTCPDCNGVMWEIDEGPVVRFRCHVGHAYTAELLNLALDEGLRRALASALRALEERVTVAQKLRRQSEDRQQHLLAATWARKAAEAQRELETVRSAVRRIDKIKMQELRGEELPEVAE